MWQITVMDGGSPYCRCILKLDVISGGLLITVAGQGTVHVVRYVLDFRLLKGTVPHDLVTSFFHNKKFLLASIDMPRDDFPVFKQSLSYSIIHCYVGVNDTDTACITGENGTG